jgi:hypothetical protein
MRHTRLSLSCAAVLFCAVLAAPVAAGTIPTTGSPLPLGQCVATPCVSTFPAGEPFFVRHGFTNEAVGALVDPGTRFELSVDGAPVSSAVQLDLVGAETGKLFVSNFRFGLTDVHVFVGCWYFEGALVQCGRRTVTFVS